MGALWYLMYKPIMKIFSERAKRIEEGQKAAQEAIAQQEKIDELMKKTDEKLKAKSAAEMKKAVQEGEKQRLAIVDQAKAEAAAAIAKMKQDWEEERAQKMQLLNQQLVNAVVATSQKLIGESIDEKKHQKLIDQELDNMLKSI